MSDEKAMPGYYSVVVKKRNPCRAYRHKTNRNASLYICQRNIPAVVLDLGSLVSWDKVKGSAVKKEGAISFQDIGFLLAGQAIRKCFSGCSLPWLYLIFG
jgi:hypothetical protein